MSGGSVLGIRFKMRWDFSGGAAGLGVAGGIGWFFCELGPFEGRNGICMSSLPLLSFLLLYKDKTIVASLERGWRQRSFLDGRNKGKTRVDMGKSRYVNCERARERERESEERR